MKTDIRGISLIEMMIVVVIISILTAIAYPSYRQYAARAKRVEATSALLQIATLQEQYYLTNKIYTADMTDLGFPVADNFLTDSESYIVNVTSADASAFSATATYQKADAEADKCATFSIDGQYIKTSTPHTDCWTNTRR